MAHLGTVVGRHARFRPDHEAVVFGEQRFTWREIDQRVNRAANALLALGLRKGDAVALVLPNCLELIELYWAAAKTGIVVVPLSPLLRGNGLLSLLRDSGSRALISTSSMVPVIEEIRSELPGVGRDRWILVDSSAAPGYIGYADLVRQASPSAPSAELSSDDVYNIIYSSGTTGLPKGIIHTHDIRANYCSVFANTFRMTPESVVMHAGSLIFNGAMVTFFPSFFLGGRYVLRARYDPTDFLETIQREKVTHMMMVPSQIVAMLDSPACTRETMRSVEMLCSVGAPLHREHRERLRKVAPGVLYELYGLTEGFITVLDREDYERKMDSVGPPAYLNEMRIVGPDGRDLPPREVGEIVGRGPFMMPGYHGRPDLTAQAIINGWLFTGDLGYVDEDGFLYLVDRKKDLIISGGINVYPKDIEEVLVQHPAVREAAVFGIPSEKWGEVPLGAVVLKTGSTITAEELRAWANTRVAAKYQQLKEVVILDDFPRSSAGKTLKRMLREPYWAGQATKI